MHSEEEDTRDRRPSTHLHVEETRKESTRDVSLSKVELAIASALMTAERDAKWPTNTLMLRLTNHLSIYSLFFIARVHVCMPTHLPSILTALLLHSYKKNVAIMMKSFSVVYAVCACELWKKRRTEGREGKKNGGVSMCVLCVGCSLFSWTLHESNRGQTGTW